jgi:hypothetical protein
MILKISNIIVAIIRSNHRYLVILLLFASITEVFKNLNVVITKNYDERIFRTYNFCGGISYGYINKIRSQYLLDEKKILIINFDAYPPSMSLFHDLAEDKNKNNIIFLNYKDSYKNKLKELELNLLNYTLVDMQDNCYYYKK